eukprot:GHVR01059227.1.p1 GENE.GHVR01059227.1~~GHVR01059227.1.p1  ORF type:complete len:190 (-),score=22.93 GHVR01059227.1:11-580(-)
MVDIHGNKFTATVVQKQSLPIIELALSGKNTAALSINVDDKGALQKACTVIENKKTILSEEALQILHLRFGHASGHRLYNTLKEKGISHRTTLAACTSVSSRCKACELINTRLNKIPPKEDGYVEAKKFNQIIYQDLINLPASSLQGHKYASVIVDSATRFVSVLALKQKSQAVQHLISWAYRRPVLFG